MTRQSLRITEVAVVVPAHDEELLVGECLAALELSAQHAGEKLGVDCRIIVVLDDCTDGTAEVVARFESVEVTAISRRNVGAARAHGVGWAIASAIAPTDRLWIANTDADSTVDAGWIVHQLAIADSGVDLVIGSVFPVGDDLTVEQADAWRRRETADPTSLHVHGANLGLRADTYLAAGGFDPHPEHEDVMLVERVIGSGAKARATDGCPVATSARRHGRTPGGFAAHLRDNY